MFRTKNKNSLKQGEQFQVMKTMYNRHIKNIGKNKYVGLLEGAGGTSNSMKNLQDEFTRTLGGYEKSYQEYLAQKINSKENVSEYLEKCIKFDSRLFYVTKKGVLKQLERPTKPGTSEQVSDDDILAGFNCPIGEPVTVDSGKFEILQKNRGRTLRAKYSQATSELIFQKITDSWNRRAQYINLAGNTIAWIDDYGWIYKFADGLKISQLNDFWPKVNSSEYKNDEVLAPEWEFLMTGGGNAREGERIESAFEGGPNRDMGKLITLDENGKLSHTSPPGKKIEAQTSLIHNNQKLQRLAVEMKRKIIDISSRTDQTEDEIIAADGALTDIINILEKKRETINILNNEIKSLDGTIIDNHNLVKAINTHYIAWGLSFVTIFLIGYHQLKK